MLLVVTVTGVSLTEPHTDEMYVHMWIYVRHCTELCVICTVNPMFCK